VDDKKKDFSIGGKKNPLRLLIMDGLAKSAEDTANMVRKLGYSIEATQVRDIEELSRQVEKGTWDLMISPPRLADSGSSQILTILARQEQDIPLLILTTNTSDPLVLDALQSGARDVVSKEMPEFFGLTIKRELEDLAQRRARIHFEKLSQEYRGKCDFLMEQALNEPAEKATASAPSAARPNTAPAPGQPAGESPPPKTTETESDAQSKKDLLTGLFNYQFFMDEFEQLLIKTAAQGVQHGLFYLELDNFNVIKEKAGIAAGDLVLGDIAKVLGGSLEDDSHIIARYGDNAFVVLKKETNQQSAQQAAELIRNNIEKHVYAVVGQSVPHTTCSIGISISSGNSSNAQDIISHAQIACQVAKSGGGNKVHLFDEKTDAQASKESDKKWEHTIRAALNENRFRLVFQPIVNLHSKPAENYEILLRMLDEDNKEILPGEFMSAAEHSGLMPELDRWVVNNALTELADRRGAGKDTTFFIKLSGMTLNDKGFPPWLSKQLNSIKLPGDSIVFEISESLAIRYPTQIKKFINWLKVLHCRSALDHFGTHPQSLDLMKELSADYLKIDRSFMHNLSGNKENKDKVKSIVGTAHALNKLTIAEFVQDANCLSVLWQCGVDYIQGYFLQRPDTAMMYEFSEF